MVNRAQGGSAILPNTACSPCAPLRQRGFVAIYGHFLRFEFILISSVIHAPPAANAGRWVALSLLPEWS